MTTTPSPSPEMLGPGQQDLLDDFVKEVEEEQSAINQTETQEQPETDEELIGGKFKNVDEVLKAYQEAERKLSEGKQETEQTETPDNWPETPDDYTRDVGIEFYGEDVTNALEKAEVNPIEMSSKFWSGQNVDAEIDALVEKGGIPRKLVDAYLQGRTKQEGSSPQQTTQKTGDADYSNIVNTVGGAEDYKAMTDWMTNNLSESELTSFNNAVDSGQSYQQKLQTVSAMKARYDLKNGGGEPKLIQGGSATATDTFDSKDQAVAAISAMDKATGRRRYDVEPKYRKWVETTMNRSNQSIFDS